MADDEIVTLDSGEQVKVTEDGERILILGPDPEIENIIARRQEQEAEQAAIRQAQLDIIEAKRAELRADPAVPPEKTIF